MTNTIYNQPYLNILYREPHPSVTLIKTYSAIYYRPRIWYGGDFKKSLVISSSKSECMIFFDFLSNYIMVLKVYCHTCHKIISKTFIIIYVNCNCCPYCKSYCFKRFKQSLIND